MLEAPRAALPLVTLPTDQPHPAAAPWGQPFGAASANGLEVGVPWTVGVPATDRDPEDAVDVFVEAGPPQQDGLAQGTSDGMTHSPASADRPVSHRSVGEQVIEPGAAALAPIARSVATRPEQARCWPTLLRSHRLPLYGTRVHESLLALLRRIPHRMIA